LPPKMEEQLRNLLSTENPKVKGAAAKLLELLTKSPTVKNSQRRQLAHKLGRSLDQYTGVNENILELTGEPNSDPNFYGSSNSSPVSVESKQFQPQYDFSEVLGSKTVGSETVLSFSDEVSGSGETAVTIEGDEKIKSSDIDLVEFSKRQEIRSRRKSLQMAEYLENMPSLSQSLAKTRGASLKESNSRSCYDIFHDKKDIGLESISSRIDELDVKIGESTQKLTELRRRSLDLLTSGGDSGAFDWNSKKLSFVSGEQEINRWQAHKNKLVDERYQITVKLHSKLWDKINASPLTYSPTKSEFLNMTDTSPVTASDTEMTSSRMRSDSITESISSLSYHELPEIVADVDLT